MLSTRGFSSFLPGQLVLRSTSHLITTAKTTLLENPHSQRHLPCGRPLPSRSRYSKGLTDCSSAPTHSVSGPPICMVLSPSAPPTSSITFYTIMMGPAWPRSPPNNQCQAVYSLTAFLLVWPAAYTRKHLPQPTLLSSPSHPPLPISDSQSIIKNTQLPHDPLFV